MKIIETEIPDVKILEPAVLGDARGFFMETWNAQVFAKAGLDLKFVQDMDLVDEKRRLLFSGRLYRHPESAFERRAQSEILVLLFDNYR